MGFMSAEQIGNPVLRGVLFENVAVVELMKKKLNNGERPDLYFYRENTSLEIDIVDPTAASMHLYEVNAGKTLNPAYSKNMKAFSEKIGMPTISTVIYDGHSFPPIAINIKELSEFMNRGQG